MNKRSCILCSNRKRHIICMSKEDNQKLKSNDIDQDDAKIIPDIPAIDHSMTTKMNSKCLSMEEIPIGGLFIQPLTGNPMVFGIRHGKELQNIRVHIWKGGGKVENPEKEPDINGNRITFCDPNSLVMPENIDTFDYQYILDCVELNAIKENLDEYRIEDSMYRAHDPLDVLLGYRRWYELKKKPSILNHNESPEVCSDIDDGIPEDKQS